MTLRCPLGDFTSTQSRALAVLARKYTGDTVRLTVDQNILFRWVPDALLPDLYEDILEIGLGEAGANTLRDIVACPGTDTCKLGISASRGLAGVLEKELVTQVAKGKEHITSLAVKVSGCFNSCGQHHIADIGFLGVSRNVKGRRVPHFQLVVGGQRKDNASTYGLAIGAFPSKVVPKVVDEMVD